MINKIDKFLNEYNLTEKNNTLLVGFSGGFDSMCLLDILYKLSKKHGFKLVALHLNHNWRKEESTNEALNCKNFCEEKNITFYTETLNENEKHTETVARALRYDFFNRAIEKFNATALFTAHTKSDIVETLIYRLIKGTGIKGLQGIAPKLGKIYRPMLDISRNDIENYCKNNNLKPNFDSSNNNNNYSRNYIRNKIIKLFPKINKNYENSIYSLSNLAFENEQLIHEYIKNLNIYKENIILTEIFKNQTKTLQKRLIYEIFVQYDIEYTQERILNSLKFISENLSSKSGKKCSLNSKYWLFVSNKEIKVITSTEKITDCIKINKEGSYKIGDFEFTIKKCNEDITKYPSDKDFKAYIELSKPIDFELRTRQNGDKIRPLGSNGDMKFKKYLISKNIPQHEKDSIILLCKDTEILWASGLGLSDKIKVVNKCTHVLTLKKIG